MAVVRQRVHCTFPKAEIGQPVLYSLGQRFPVIPNVRRASITEDHGVVDLEIEGEQSEVDKAVAYLQEREVQCKLEGPPSVVSEG